MFGEPLEGSHFAGAGHPGPVNHCETLAFPPVMGRRARGLSRGANLTLVHCLAAVLRTDRRGLRGEADWLQG